MSNPTDRPQANHQAAAGNCPDHGPACWREKRPLEVVHRLGQGGRIVASEPVRVSPPPVGRCPRWCDTDHAATDWQERYVSDDGFTVYDLRTHSRDVGVFDNPAVGPGRKVHVSVRIVDDLQEGVRLPAAVSVDGAEDLTPELARMVGDALHDAARLLSGC